MRFWTSGMLTMVLTACGPVNGAGDSEGTVVNVVSYSPNAPAVKPAKPSPFASHYTSGGVEPCRLIEKNEEEGGYFRHRCPGIAGFDYDLVESDLRQSLVVIHANGRRDDVALASVVGGGGFSVLGPTIEWRGPARKPPTTMTVRFNVHENSDGKAPDRSYLVVVRLASPSCPVAAVSPGPGQNERARAIADRRPLECLSA